MSRQVFGDGQRDHSVGNLTQRVAGVVDDMDAAQEGLHAQAAGVPAQAPPALGSDVVEIRAQ